MYGIFRTRNTSYNLRSQIGFRRTSGNNSGFGINALKCLATKVLHITPYHIDSIRKVDFSKRE